MFSSDRVGLAYNTEALEKLLKEELGEDMTMSDVKFPKYVPHFFLFPPLSLFLSPTYLPSLCYYSLVYKLSVSDSVLDETTKRQNLEACIYGR